MIEIAILGGGFLLAVLWMDLMFDVQVFRHRAAGGDLPEEVLASIAGYYRRVTTLASPMGHAIGAVMIVTLAAVALEIVRGPSWLGLVSLPFCGGPIGLALARVVPNAVRLGTRADPPSVQSALARGICRDHVFCLASIAAFVAIQAAAALCAAPDSLARGAWICPSSSFRAAATRCCSSVSSAGAGRNGTSSTDDTRQNAPPPVTSSSPPNVAERRVHGAHRRPAGRCWHASNHPGPAGRRPFDRPDERSSGPAALYER
jgi:hypothetical protein